MSWEDDGEWLVNSNLEECIWKGRKWTETNGSLLDWAAHTCNPAQSSVWNALASETSDMCAQAEAYDVETLQCGTCLRHEEPYQVPYVLSHWTCVPRSGSVDQRSGEPSPVDTDYVEIASIQISWKENSTWFQSLLFTRYYIIFPSGLTVWLTLKLRAGGCGCSEYWDYWRVLLAVTSRGMVDRYWRLEV
jgi:hypothetical protein